MSRVETRNGCCGAVPVDSALVADHVTVSRNARIVRAVKTSLLSKGATFLIQLVAMPLVARRLGPEAFGVYAALSAMLSWFSAADLGIGPALGHKIALGVARGDRSIQSRYFTAAVTSGSTLAVVVLIFGGVVLCSGNVLAMFGPNFSAHKDNIYWGFSITILVAALQLIVSVGAKARAGFQEVHINNTFGAAENIIKTIGLVVAVWFCPEVLCILTIIYGVGLLAGAGNLLSLLRRRPYLWGGPRAGDVTAARELLTDGVFYAIALGLIGLQREFSKLLLGQTTGPTEVGQFSILTALIMTMAGVMIMLTAPLWPAVADARIRDDHEWLTNLRRRLWKLSWIYGLTALAAVGLAGGPFVSMLYGDQYAIGPSSFWLLGVYFLALMLGHVRFTWLMGYGAMRSLALIAVGEFLSNGICLLIMRERLSIDVILIVLLINHLLFSVAWQGTLVARTTARTA